MSQRVLSRWPFAPVVTFEDAFLRSVLPGLGSPPIGLNIDDIGVHFDARHPSRLEELLTSGSHETPDLLQRAEQGLAFLRHYGLSKYNAVPRGYGACPATGYVLVIDQVAGDASIEGGLADAGSFAAMLTAARGENPDARIVIRTHPAVSGGDKHGYFSTADVGENVELSQGSLNPWDLLEGAAKVYCVSSQMGFEAILAGHRPEVFGVPFYAGWGLTNDRQTVPRRGRELSVNQLFAGAMLTYPFWYNHARRSACEFEEAAQQLLAQARLHWDGLQSTTALGMSLWKRQNVARFLSGGGQSVTFAQSDERAVAQAKKRGGKVVVWAGKESPTLSEQCCAADVPLIRMEDGFLRSTGLGAALTPAASLVLDAEGIYYNPASTSQLEGLIMASVHLSGFALERAKNLRSKILEAGVSKYNLKGGEVLNIPSDRKIILVPGQVEDDASIHLGGGEAKTNFALLKAARSADPDAYIVYKPHPDVVAGLREGAIADQQALAFCDRVLVDVDTSELIAACDEVWTMTSLLGFEALLRGKVVTCLGTPFYAGWGLTRDLGPRCPRRGAQVSLDQLVHAALLDYPRYMDPISKLPCTAELIVDRLANGVSMQPSTLRILAKLQGLFASRASIWR